MNDVTELFLGALAVVLGGAAFAVGGRVLRDAWRGSTVPLLPLGPGAAPAAAGSHPPVLRLIAAFEAFKGLVAIAAVAGLLGMVHHDLRHAASALVGHIGLSPGGHYPTDAILRFDHWWAEDRSLLLLAVAGYVLLRFAEAYGLWFARPWGEGLGAWSGGLYVPFELMHLLHRPSALAVLVLAGNVAVVGFLARRAWLRRRATAPRTRA